jgi:glutamine synthetase
LFSSLKEAKEYCKTRGIKIVDFKITDLNGRWHHLSIPVERLGENVFEEGIGFDGSSYGYSTVEKSDMVFIPDLSTAFVDPFCEEPTLSMIGDIHKLDGGVSRYEGDPRYIAEKAEKYMISSGIADENIIGPEFEFYIFDHIAYDNKPNHQEVSVGRLVWVVETSFPAEDDETICELGFYYLMELPVDSPWLRSPGPFHGKEGKEPLEYRGVRLEQLPALTLYPSFLRTELNQLPGVTTHRIERNP